MQLVIVTMAPLSPEVGVVALQHLMKHLVVAGNEKVIASFQVLHNLPGQ